MSGVSWNELLAVLCCVVFRKYKVKTVGRDVAWYDAESVCTPIRLANGLTDRPTFFEKEAVKKD